MKVLIPTTLDNYKEKKTWRGIESSSTTFYKGHKIFLKSCAMDGIYCRVTKIGWFNDRVIAKELYSSIEAKMLLKWTKNMIDARKSKVKFYCWLFHQEFLEEQYSSVGRPIKICMKCKTIK